MKTFIDQKESLEADPIMLLRQLIINIEAKKDATSDEEVLEINNQIRQLVERLPSGYVNNNVDGRCPIHLAVYQSDYETIELLSSHGANFNFLDDLGNAPLFYALNNRDTRATGLLLRNGASKEFLGEGQPKPLFITIDKEDLENTELLLENGANPNSEDGDNTYLHQAYNIKHNKDIVKILLKYKANPDITPPITGPVLISACRNHDREMVELFLAHKADPNLPNELGNYPLYYMCHSFDHINTKLLLEHGADPNLINNEEHEFPIHFAYYMGRKKVFQLIIEKVIDVNLPDSAGNYFVHMACRNKDIETVSLLLGRGANPYLPDSEGNSAFYYASFNKDNKMLKLLSEEYKGTDEEKTSELVDKNIEKATANRLFYEACRNHDYKKMELLLEKGATANITVQGAKPVRKPVFTKDQSIIHEDSIWSDKKTLEILVKQPGIDVNCEDRNGATIIGKACSAHKLELVEFLLERGATTCGGHYLYELLKEPTVDDEAAKKTDEAIAKLLLFIKETKTDYIDNKGNTLLHLVCSRKNPDPEVLKLLIEKIDVAIRNHKGQLASDILEETHPELMELFPVSVSTKLVKSAGEDLHELLLDHPTKELEFKESELYGALTPEGE
ncbi:MAG: ankyrin repeat domain-containing protein [Rickettsiales bacterium]|nr:ankyrin repeat domain-containing protein [Rickettsiales bacterium]